MIRSDNRQFANAQADPDIGYIIDAPHEGAPLIITFGFVDWAALPKFDFVGRLRKLEATTGQPLNLILIRDTANFWYQHGVDGLGRDVDAVAASLRHIIADLRPSSICTVGQSMGGYAAILFGALLGVDQVLAFGPLSYLRSDWARRDGDLRWLSVMETLDRHPPARRYDDLTALLAGLPHPPVHILFGTGAEAEGGLNMDEVHARRFSGIAGVTVERIPEAPHAVVKWLIDTGHMDNILLLWWSPVANPGRERPRNIMPSCDAALPEEVVHDVFNDGWRAWIGENLALGASPEGLLPALVAHNFHPGEARREIDKAYRSPYLQAARRLASRVAKRDWTLDVQQRVRAMGARDNAGIERRHKLDRATFLNDYYSANRPVVITGMMEDWPALGWTPEQLVCTFAGRQVEVQVNRSANPHYEMQADSHGTTMAFDAFMARIMAMGESNDIYMTARNGGANASALSELWDGIVQIPEYLDGGNPANRGFFWIGPPGTVTPTHHDLTNNFMAQITGRKRVHLADGLQVANLYNHLHVYSEVDLEKVDYDRFPRMQNVDIFCHDLAPGELLFIPVGWWHHVRALDFSMTVTFTNFLFDNDFCSTYQSYQVL
ncbi:cupin-like domain-containing protein [Sphingobium sp. BYY-5]|uniref:cupin-like domain-containing protein n=1 Tax=Sphingobium sp. BYY-5 TaxID=2926400 RepID=UPI001FA72D96|nr:cupin-like domain-containing protein [Sphingobium sp. BYY-5]MCI4592201.1 cupin-like domain-containing protein [Sphingobium sp. BYY-5]